MSVESVIIRQLGTLDYRECWQRMRDFTDQRDAATLDELWVVQHQGVFTLGQAAKPEHLLAPGEIPVIQTDRGGQVTYHGPGQVVIYLLVNLRRRQLAVRQLVSIIEDSIVSFLGRWGISANARADAPGVYVDKAKIAALGLRVRRGCSYHGLAFNFDLDLQPFQRINPCGYEGLAVTRLVDLMAQDMLTKDVEDGLLEELKLKLGYNRLIYEHVYPDIK